MCILPNLRAALKNLPAREIGDHSRSAETMKSSRDRRFPVSPLSSCELGFLQHSLPQTRTGFSSSGVLPSCSFPVPCMNAGGLAREQTSQELTGSGWTWQLCPGPCLAGPPPAQHLQVGIPPLLSVQGREREPGCVPPGTELRSAPCRIHPRKHLAETFPI